MCLTKWTRVRKTEGFGWKIFAQKGGKLYSTDCAPPMEQKHPRPLGKWITATVYKSVLKYVVGFHIFKKRKDARYVCAYYSNKNYVVCKVHYRKARFLGPVIWSLGWESRETLAIVADKIKILSE